MKVYNSVSTKINSKLDFVYVMERECDLHNAQVRCVMILHIAYKLSKTYKICHKNS